ncbi:MAG: hypothetical protein JXR07_12610 [Reichenbachiella sp.]
MRNILKMIVLAVCFMTLNSFNSRAQVEHGVVFFKINNQALILVNGKQVYDSGHIHGDTDLELPVDLAPFMKKGTNEVEVRLINPPCGSCDSNPWEIVFEIYEDGESIDYWFENSERGDALATGLVSTQVYEIEYN